MERKDVKKILSQKITYAICDYFDIKYQKLYESKGSGGLSQCQCRQFICHFIYSNNLGSCLQVGNLINRKPNMVIYSIEVVKNLCASDPLFKRNFVNLEFIVNDILKESLEII